MKSRLFQMICIHRQILFVWWDEEELAGTCKAYGGEERRMRGFGEEIWGKETTSKI
jgi:hypothetical protein